MAIGLKKLLAGSGYGYPTRSVPGDVTSLADYYTAKGETPAGGGVRLGWGWPRATR